MAKTIAVSDEVYRKLKKARMPGESFSSTIRRTLEARPKLTDIVGKGILTHEDWAKTRKVIAKSEKMTLEKLERKA
jgi:predicted CopG family antitoxin